MSTVSTQPQFPKGLRICRKFRRMIIFAIFFGLFAYSMSILVQARVNSGQNISSSRYSDHAMYKLAEEVKELKEAQSYNKKWIEHLHNNQQHILRNQETLNEVKDGLVQEFSRIEHVAMKTQDTLQKVLAHIKQQDSSINSLSKTVEMNRGDNSGNQQTNYELLKLHKNQKELANKLEAFNGILRGFEVKMYENQDKVNEAVADAINWISSHAATKHDLKTLSHNGNNNIQEQLVNEIKNQKALVNQATQNSARQANEIREINRILTGLKDYVLEALENLAQKNNANEKRISNVENTRVSGNSNVKVSNEVSQMVTDFKNFKEYTMEALQELRSFNNKNSKRINSIKSKDSEAIPSETLYNEIEKFFSNLDDGKLLEKILGEVNMNMRELQTFVSIIKKLVEGDVNGVLNSLNELAGGNLMEQLMNAKEGIMKDLKPYMKYAKLLKNFVGGDNENEPVQKEQPNNNRRRHQPNKKFNIDDLLEWL